MHIAYQPIIDLQTGTIEKCEALCRPEEAGNDVAAFVVAAEGNGTIKAFTERVLDEVFADWHKSGPAQVAVSVNVSVANLAEADLAKRLEKLLKRRRFDAAKLWLEIDDRAQTVGDAVSLKTMSQIRGLGVRFSIDSFGDDFSYTTIYEIERLPIAELKIDSRYVQDADVNMRHRERIASTVAIARQLNLSTCAKGIENETIARLAARLGCTFGQGYHFSRPVSAEALGAIARSGAALGAAVRQVP